MDEKFIEAVAMSYIANKYGETFTMDMVVPAERERARDIGRRTLSILHEQEMEIVSTKVGR